MTAITMEQEIRELKRRLDLAETRLSQPEGRFEFISGQLREIQLYMHARFAEVDKRFDRLEVRVDKLEAKFDKLDAKVDALPRVIAEMLDERRPRRS